MTTKLEWTHAKISITDIRKVNKFYILRIRDDKIITPLFVDKGIFEARMNSYFFSDDDFSRDQVMSVKWNMVINKGFFIKVDKTGKIEEHRKDDDKFYVSFLEIDGPLGSRMIN